MLRHRITLCVILAFACLCYADQLIVPPKWPELELLVEHPIDNMAEGNLSGIANCIDGLWVESDRADLYIYKLISQTNTSVLTAQAVVFKAKTVPKNALSLFNSLGNVAIGLLRGGIYDFEGISCDAYGNKYLVSEAYLAVLKISKEGQTQWLTLPDMLWQQAKAQGLLQKTNQLLEGIAISPDGKRMWLAAERNKRGILTLIYNEQSGWQCPNEQCVLLAEGGVEHFPPAFRRKNRIDARDFSDLVFYNEKLFTLERSAFRICRRDLQANIEQCWSFAKEALQPQRQYLGYGMPEALWIDEKGAWIGVDSDITNQRVDGETRPIIWRFAAPEQGWLSTRGELKP